MKMKRSVISILLSAALMMMSVDLTAFAAESDMKAAAETEMQKTGEIGENSEGASGCAEENTTEQETDTDVTQIFEESTQIKETNSVNDKDESASVEEKSQIEQKTETQTDFETEKTSASENEEESVAIISDEGTESLTEMASEGLIDDSTVTVTASNSFGRLLTKSMEEEILELEQTPANNISSITVNESQAIVEFGCVQDATLVVAIYDEVGTKMLASGKTEVTAQQIKVTVNIDAVNMPDYFIARGYLVDTDTLKPLSSVYETPMYTREMQELLNKTTDDFEASKIINLDDNKDTNFAVTDDDTTVISNIDGENIITQFDNDTQLCVIANVNEEITSLQEGDIFVYEYEENEILIVKIADILVDEELDGTKTATIYGQETSLDEAFAYLKIDTESELDKAQIDTSETVDGVAYKGIYNEHNTRALIDEDDNISWSVKFEFLDEKSEDSNDKLTGDVSVGIDFKTKVYLSLSYHYIEIKCDYKLEVGLTVSSKCDYIKKELLKKPIGISPVTGVYIEFMPSFVIEAKAKISVKGNIKGTFGYAISKDEGIKIFLPNRLSK